MSTIARDSGIVADDESSETSSITYDKLSYVQKLRKRFEILATEAEREFHANTNWWLDDEDVTENEENSDSLTVIEEPKLQQQISTTSEKSHRSSRSQVSNHSEKPPESPQKFVPEIKFEEFEDKQDEDDSFESANDMDEVFEEQSFVRKPEKKSDLSRNGSILSNVSK